MGEVYRAKETPLERSIAITLIMGKKGVSFDPKPLQRPAA